MHHPMMLYGGTKFIYRHTVIWKAEYHTTARSNICCTRLTTEVQLPADGLVSIITATNLIGSCMKFCVTIVAMRSAQSGYQKYVWDLLA